MPLGLERPRTTSTGLAARLTRLVRSARDHNGDDYSIEIQIDLSKGQRNFYIHRSPTRSRIGETEPRKIREPRFVAVDMFGRPVGTPTPCIEPPGGSDPP